MSKDLIRVGHTTFSIIWRNDYKFVGVITKEGFGRYIGITFKRKEWA